MPPADGAPRAIRVRRPGAGANPLRDGRELLLAGSRDLGPASRAIVVEDPPR